MSVRNLFNLTGKVAVVTGGSRGLGLRIAEALGQLGAAVAIVARKPGELADARRILEKTGVDVACFPADLAQPQAIGPLVDAVVARFGKIDILVNNAGASWGQLAEKHSLEGWRKVMALNVEGVFLLTQEIGRREFIPRGVGRIVNIASVGGLRGNRPELAAYTLAYSTSKGAIVNFTRALACEWGRYGITVNALCPGFFRSRLADGLIDRLEASGHVERRTDSRDRRIKCVYITDKGYVLIEQMAIVARDLNGIILKNIPLDQIHVAEDVMALMKTNLRDHLRAQGITPDAD